MRPYSGRVVFFVLNRMDRDHHVPPDLERFDVALIEHGVGMPGGDKFRLIGVAGDQFPGDVLNVRILVLVRHGRAGTLRGEV